MSPVFPSHLRNFPSLVIIDSRLCRLHIACRPRLNFNETKYIAIPPNQVDLASTTGRAIVARDHDITYLAKIEVRVLFSFDAYPQMSRPLIGWKYAEREPVEAPDHRPREEGGKHNDFFRIGVAQSA